MGFLQTFLLTEAVVFGALGIAVRFLAGREAGTGVRIWSLAGVFLAVSQAILAFRSQLPPIVGQGAFQLCWSLGHIGMLLALQRRSIDLGTGLRVAGLLTVHLTIFWLLDYADPSYRLPYVGLFNITLSCLQAHAAWQIWRNERLKGGLLICCTLLAWTSMLLIALAAIFTGHPFPEYGQDYGPISILHSGSMLALLLMHAGFISVALERAAAHQAMADAVARAETERRLLTEAANQKLKHMLDERAELLDLLAHEIRQPLNTASAALESLTPSLVSLDKRQRTSDAGRVINAVMLTLGNVLAAATSLQRKTAQMAECDLAETAELAKLSFPEPLRRRIFIDCPAGLAIETDAELLGLALRNMLDNGLKHGQGHVKLSLKQAGNGLTIAATNKARNPGKPEKLFAKGARGSNSGSSGAGLGLHIVKRVAEMLRGKVKAQWRGGEFRIEMRIPA